MATNKHSSVPAGFKEIPGYDGRYFINEKGEVWSMARKRLMCPQVHKTMGYPQVLLQTPGKGARATNLHYLMRITWMPPAPGPIGIRRGQWCINHIDGNKLNNDISNLEWLTCENNVKHAWDNGLNHTAIGEDAKNAKFTSEQVRQIRLAIIDGAKTKALADQCNCGVEVIKKIKNFSSWKHQDHDLVELLMTVCKSKWLRVMNTKLKNGERMEECCNRISRGHNKWNKESLARYL